MNRHEVNLRGILSPLCLPIPPHRQLCLRIKLNSNISFKSQFFLLLSLKKNYTFKKIDKYSYIKVAFDDSDVRFDNYYIKPYAIMNDSNVKKVRSHVKKDNRCIVYL